jgi:hypothetical protein
MALRLTDTQTVALNNLLKSAEVASDWLIDSDESTDQYGRGMDLWSDLDAFKGSFDH